MSFSHDAANYYSKAGGHKEGDATQAARVICNNEHPGENATMWSKGNDPGAWFSIDLMSVELQPTSFAYRNDYGGGGNHPRTFELQGSNDGSSWTTVSAHKREIWSGKSEAKSWPINADVKCYYRIFRVINQGAPNHLCCAGIELYGHARSVSAMSVNLGSSGSTVKLPVRGKASSEHPELIVQNVLATRSSTEAAQRPAPMVSQKSLNAGKMARTASAAKGLSAAPKQVDVNQRVWDTTAIVVKDAAAPLFQPFKVFAGGDRLTFSFGADDLFDEIYYNGRNVTNLVDNYSTDANKLKTLEVVNAGPNAVFAIAVHDYEPGDAAAFFLKVTSDNSGSDWHGYEVRPKVDGTRCFGVAGTGKHAKGTHRDMRNMQRPTENAPPDGWFENDFDDEAWSAPTRPTNGMGRETRLRRLLVPQVQVHVLPNQSGRRVVAVSWMGL